MEHTGRNDPCPCGSGRKYKKCCQPHEAERAAFADALTRIALPLLSQLARFAERAAGLPLHAVARQEFPFWKRALSKAQGARVVDFLMFDCRPKLYARRTVEEFAATAGPGLGDEARAVLERWVDAPRRLYRAVQWSGGFTTCADLLDEAAQPIEVFDIEGSWKPATGDAFALRALPVEHANICAGTPIGFGSRPADDVADAMRRRHLDFVRTQRIAGINEFLRRAPTALDEEAANPAGTSTIVLPGA